MPGRRFHTVDVFARDSYTGNQLAVIHDAADLDVRVGGRVVPLSEGHLLQST